MAGDADGAELQVDGPAQAGNLCGEEEYGERAGLGKGPGPARAGGLNREQELPRWAWSPFR